MKNKKQGGSSRLAPPPGTIAVWFVHVGDWMNRRDLYVARSRPEAVAWQQSNYQRGIKVSAAHIIRIRGRWYKMMVTPVACYVPPQWNPTADWLRDALDLQSQPTPKLSWSQRLRALFTAHPSQVGETYWQHMRRALHVGIILLIAAFQCLIHAVCPAFFTTSASKTVHRLSADFTDLYRKSRRYDEHSSF